MKITKWSRNCPKCDGLVYHTNKKCRDDAVIKKRTCGGKIGLNCKVISQKQIQQLKNAFKGKPLNHNQKNRRKKSEPTKFFRNCPNCRKVLYYADIGSIRYSEKRKTLCDSCTNYKYKKSWNNVITEDSIKKMRASKSGFSSWSEYQEKMPLWKKYKADVWKITYKSLKTNPRLKNYNLRGLCGINGAYQIDHIIGVKYGFDNNIPTTAIGIYENLRMIPWKENRNKR